MSLTDIIILIIVVGIMGTLSYFMFFKKKQTQCCNCSVMIQAKRKGRNMKKFYNKQA